MVKVSMIKVSNPFSNIPPLFSDLAKSLAGELDCSSLKLEEYSRDNSPYTVRPQAILYPKHASDIKNILAFSREYTMPVTVRGNGKGNQGGSLSEGLIIDMTRYFTHIRQINMLEHTITVDAGVSIKELREKLHGWKMEIPVLTAQDNDSTVGALVSTKSSNPSSFHFGTIREWIEAITVVVDTGEEHRIADGITPSGRLLGIYQAIFPILTSSGPVLRAAKPEMSDDATGYCLWNTSIGPRQLIDQIVGSEGTLGIITSVTLRLTPYKPYTKTISIPFTDKKRLESSIKIAREHKAEHIFLCDATYAELLQRYHPELSLPCDDADYILLISFFGNNQEEIEKHMKQCVSLLSIQKENLAYLENPTIINSITNPSLLLSLFSSYTQNSHTPIPFCDGIIVHHDKYIHLLEEIEDYLYSTGRLYVITGNSGSGHISIVTLFDPQSRMYENDIATYNQTIYTLTKKYKGGISAQSGEGIAKTPYIPFFYNEATISVFTAIKKAWDPLLILNPGKKIGTTLTYLQNHLTRRDSR